MDGVGQEQEDDGDAARAFEALREEVAALRRGVELVYRQGQQTGTAAPDYSPTLGTMEKALRTIAVRMEAVERQPALTLTPASFRTEIDSVARSVAGTASQPFADAVQEVRFAARDLTALAGQVRDRQEQRVWVLTAAACGLVVGVGLWYVAAGLLPRSAGDWIAASLIGGSRWQAGQILMEEASPASWDKMVRLYNACPPDSTTEVCEAAEAVRTITPDTTASSFHTAPRSGHVIPNATNQRRPTKLQAP
jgi:hypothetical protein